ncbi:hypothetical protein Barb7_02427 [Bacteroidales bacterium Barb7]|nr:hypothetical protein Barb7_02427 [Bacteroidales bacterium Barb7]
MKAAAVPPFLHRAVFLLKSCIVGKKIAGGGSMMPVNLANQSAYDTAFVRPPHNRHFLVKTGRPAVHLPLQPVQVERHILRRGFQQQKQVVQINQQIGGHIIPIKYHPVQKPP